MSTILDVWRLKLHIKNIEISRNIDNFVLNYQLLYALNLSAHLFMEQQY